ncbi:MAG: ypiP [Bacillales bacterium]|jgi:16S rRNA G966 N2-methylase RsmD|nr:ypiP [Bacillales bacterium]
MKITTAGRTTNEMVEYAKLISIQLSCDYVSRDKRSIEFLTNLYNDDFIVVGQNRLELHSITSDNPFFFHPNSSLFRIKRIINNKKDPLVDACELKPGDSFLDCTMGLGSDAIVASFIAGQSGKVIGIESNKYIAFIVNEGLQRYVYDINKDIEESLRRINVVNKNNLNYLKDQTSSTFDIVYFDPMFSKSIEISNGINKIRNLADYATLTDEVFVEALRVAKRKVVIKEHYKSEIFNHFNLNVDKRKTSLFHFGYVNK